MNKKQELEGLKQEETRLEQQQEEFRERLETISQNLQESQLQISQVNYYQNNLYIFIEHLLFLLLELCTYIIV